jgi:hypothetical protein
MNKFFRFITLLFIFILPLVMLGCSDYEPPTIYAPQFPVILAQITDTIMVAIPVKYSESVELVAENYTLGARLINYQLIAPEIKIYSYDEYNTYYYSNGASYRCVCGDGGYGAIYEITLAPLEMEAIVSDTNP